MLVVPDPCQQVNEIRYLALLNCSRCIGATLVRRAVGNLVVKGSVHGVVV